jgi:hypothetical protein
MHPRKVILRKSLLQVEFRVRSNALFQPFKSSSVEKVVESVKGDGRLVNRKCTVHHVVDQIRRTFFLELEELSHFSINLSLPKWSLGSRLDEVKM